MDAEEIAGLKPKLLGYLQEFGDCFITGATAAHLPVYICGQLSDLARKSVEPMALQAKVAPRTLQEFLSLLEWDEDLMRRQTQQIVARDHSGPHAIAIIDETGCPKKGEKTPGVQRQHCGATGKIDNCVVTVHLGYAHDSFHCLLASELYLPQSWAEDRPRCREAGIPDDMTYRPKWQIALELLDESLGNGMQFPWLTFDEGYGSKPPFLRGLEERKLRYVAELPCNVRVWLDPPRVTKRKFRRRGRGRGRSSARLVSGSRPPMELANLLRYSPDVRKKHWRAYRVKDGTQGPMVWQVKHLTVYVQDERGLPSGPMHLVIAANPLNMSEIKYFLSNAEPNTRLQHLLLVAFSRWHVERCFEDEKTELGFDHFEGRKYIGLKRHQAITAVSHLFLAKVHQELRKKKSPPDGLPSAHGRRRASAIDVARAGSDSARRRENRLRPGQPVPVLQKSHEAHASPARPDRNRPRQNPPLRVGHLREIAL